MYCRVDSEHFDKFVELVGEQFGVGVAGSITAMSRISDSVVVAVMCDRVKSGSAEYMDEEGYFMSKFGYTEFTGAWSIYNNTLPMSDLTDEQAAKLFNALK